MSAIVRETADPVAALRSRGRLPLVLGGDCTITLGVLAGLARSSNIGVIYFDGDADLNTPDHTDSGVLDGMGMTHLLGGGHAELARIGPRYPLIGDQQVELFGFYPAELDTGQWGQVAARRLSATPATAVRADPGGSADAAIARLGQHTDALLVHLDVDVLDTGAFPLANFPHFHGLTLDQAATALQRFCAAPTPAGIVITEVTPTTTPTVTSCRPWSKP